MLEMKLHEKGFYYYTGLTPTGKYVCVISNYRNMKQMYYSVAIDKNR